VPAAARHGLRVAVTFSIALPVTLTVSDTLADAVSHPVSESVRDGQQPRGRGYALAFPIGLVAADTTPPVLAIAVRFRLAFRDRHGFRRPRRGGLHQQRDP
jgi:hypothetical protein